MKNLILKMKHFDKGRRGNGINYYVIYTILFFAVSGMVFFWFYYNNKSMVVLGDGMKQHYNSLAYYGKYLREIVTTLFTTGKLEIPMWDSHIGMGSDIITTLHYYVIGDPLTLLSVFVPASRADILYEALIILRLFLAGVGFSVYCRIMKKSRFATICGSFVYIFCAFSLYSAVRHPFFVTPMIYFPLILAGIEKIFGGKKPYLFIVSVFLAAISNFYFFYMISILIFVYAAIRFFVIFREHRVRSFFQCIGKFCGYYIVGVLMSCVIFLPNIIALLSTQRFDSSASVTLFYELDYYRRMLFGIMSSDLLGKWSFMGCSAIVFPAIVLLFMKRKQNGYLKVWFLVFTAFFAFPFIGHVLNGFSYVSNRWSWGFSLVVAFILTTMIPEFLKITKRQWGILAASSAAYFLLWYVMPDKTQGERYESWVVLGCSIAVLGLIIFLRSRPRISVGLSRGIVYAGIFTVTIAGILVHSNRAYNSSSASLSGFAVRGTPYGKLTQDVSRALKAMEDPEFYRFEVLGKTPQYTVRNAAMLNKVNGLAFYFSISDPVISKFLYENSTDIKNSYGYGGLDNRVMLDTLANVKYQIGMKPQKTNPFYGYEEVQSAELEALPYKVYENKMALPLGYTYDNYFLKTTYDSLPPTQKQEAMLQAVVVDKDIEELEKISPQITSSSVPYTVECQEGVTYENGVFHVKKPSAVATVSFEGLENSETYIQFHNLGYKSTRSVKEGQIRIKSNGLGKVLTVHTKEYRSYVEKSEEVSNLGYSKKPLKSLKIIFDSKGKFTTKGMQVICQPMENYDTQVNQLKEDTLENVEFGTNRITGDISLPSMKLLCLGIPYSKGWTAYVDGEKTELLRVNSMYSGLLLEPGQHQVEMKYVTTGVKAGILCSVIGILSLVGIAAFSRRSQKFKQRIDE